METQPAASRLSPEIGLLARGDIATVQAVFDTLSEEQRRQRFHVPMPRLPDYLLHLLADADGARHAALVLTVGGRPAGIARYVFTGAGEGELAIAVGSEFAHRGYGTGLLEALLAHAHSHGLDRLAFEFLADNRAARQLVLRHGGALEHSGTKVVGFLATAPATSVRPARALAG